MAFNHGQVPHLLPQSYKRMVSEWLEEDCPSFDYGGFVVGEEVAEARLLGKSAVCSLFVSLTSLLLDFCIVSQRYLHKLLSIHGSA